MDRLRLLITYDVKKVSLSVLAKAEIVLEYDTGGFYYVWKDKLHGYKGSLHKSILIPYLRGDFHK